MSPPGNDLDVIDPETIRVGFRGEQLEIQPLTIGQLPRLVRAAKPVIDAIADSPALASDDGDLFGMVADLIGEHGEAVIEAVAIATGRPAQFIAAGNLAEFTELAMKVVEVNRDFFAHRLGPLLARARPAAKAAMTGAGPTPSSSSENAATH